MAVETLVFARKNVAAQSNDGYASDTLLHRCQLLFGVQTQVTRRGQQIGFDDKPKRWIVKRPFGWLNRFRHLSKDYEHCPANLEGLVYLSMIHPMLRGLSC